MPSSSPSTNNTSSDSPVRRDKNYRQRLNGFGEPAANPQPRWTAAETELLKKTVQEFCASHQMHNPADIFDKEKRQQHMGSAAGGVWYTIAQKFPQRQVMSVYKKAQRLQFQQGTVRGPWSDDETQRLLQLVQTHGTKWSKVGPLLNRTPDSCHDRYREKHNHNYQHGAWTEQELQKYHALIEEYQTSHPSDPLPWSLISQRLGTRSRVACQDKWRKKIDKEPSTPRPQPSTTNGPKRKAPAPKNPSKTKKKRLSEQKDLHKETREMEEGSSVQKQPSAAIRTSSKSVVGQKTQRPPYAENQSTATADNLPPLPDLFEAIDQIFVESDLHTQSINGMLQQLRSQLKINGEFPKKTRKSLQLRVKDLALGKITPLLKKKKKNIQTPQQQQTPPKDPHSSGSGTTVTAEPDPKKDATTNTNNDTRTSESPNKNTLDNDTPDTVEAYPVNANEKDKQEKTNSQQNEDKHLDVVAKKDTTTRVSTKQVVSDIHAFLQKAPRQTLKKKALQKDLQAKYQFASKKAAKKLLKKALKKDARRFQLEGKRVTLITTL